MKLTNLTFKELLKTNPKLTFLIGAGCSVDSPSSLPAGRPMTEALIKFVCVESEVPKILELDLRYEALVEIIRNNLDKELELIDYYGLCDKPNIHHFFLAEMIRKGHFVLTTNFDFLIEYALLQSNIPKENILPVITKDDFKKYCDPVALFHQGKMALYKIHGSPKNFITWENTKDSLITTLQAFGANKEGMNVFQIEPSKRPLFDNITKERSLIVLGYSGRDDFDIVPTLKVLNLKNILWFNYLKEDAGKETIYEIEVSDGDNFEKLDKINQILVEIKQMNDRMQIWRIDTNTPRLIKEMLGAKAPISLKSFSINLLNWLRGNLSTPDRFLKLYIPFVLFLDFNKYDDALRIANAGLRLAEELDNQYWKGTFYSGIGRVSYEQGALADASKYYELALDIFTMLKNTSLQANLSNGLGLISHKKGNYSEALSFFEKVLAADVNNENVLNNIGKVYYELGKYDDALKFYEKALQIAEKSGFLNEKADYLNSIALLFEARGNYDRALEYYNEALQISDNLSAFFAKATYLANIGGVYHEKGNFIKALQYYEEAFNIAEKLGNKSKIITYMNNIGVMKSELGRFSEALIEYQKVLKLAESLGDLKEKAAVFNHISHLFNDLGNYSEALNWGKKGLEIATNMNQSKFIAQFLSDIASIYINQGNFSDALANIKQAQHINEELGDSNGKIDVLNTIGEVYRKQGKNSEAMEYFNNALQIAKQIGSSNRVGTILRDVGLVYKIEGLFDDAIRSYEESIKTFEELGNLRAKSMSMISLSGLFQKQGNIAVALDWLFKALKIGENINDPIVKANTMYNIGLLYYTQKKDLEALDCFKKALTFYTEEGHEYGKAECFLEIIKIYENQGDLDKALKIGLEALATAEKSRKIDSISKYLGLIGTIYMKQGNLLKALEFLETLHKLLIQEHRENTEEASFAKQAIVFIKSKMK